MIETITLKNFKGFKSLDNMAIKPITILCGTNSSGKSSILQSILLFKQTVESKNPNQTLLLNGRFTHLGTFENIIFEKKLDNDVVLDFSFKVTKQIAYFERHRGISPIHYYLKDLVSQESWDLKQAEYLICYSIALETFSERQNDSFSETYLMPIRIKYLSFKVETRTPEGEIVPEAHIEMRYEENNRYEVKWKNVYSRLFRGEKPSSGKNIKVRVDFANLFPVHIRLVGEKDAREKPPAVTYTLHRLSQIFQYFLTPLTYIGPLREEPSRRYIYEDEIVEIGTKGENAAYLYMAEQDNEIKNHFFYNPTLNLFFEEKNTLKLKEAVKRWLDLMRIYDFKTEPTGEIIYLNLKSSSAEDTRVSIADTGFGVSQIFPIVLEGLRMRRHSTLLLEQPEIHLHPNLQMQLADYFIALALSKKQVVVETHSDHIVNRIVRRIVEDEELNLKKLVGLYFIEPTDNGAIYKEINIDDKSGIRNWPENFFDQTAMEQEQTMRAGLKKRKIESENE